jgi:hypothetical protein
MEQIFVSYHPGAMGNFIKMLICSGLPKYYLHKNHLMYKDEVVYILDDSGEVIPYYESDFDKFLTDIFFENFSEIWIKNPKKIIETVVRIYNKKMSNNYVVSGGHLHTSMHTNNKLDYAFEFIKRANNIDRCLFITINSEKEYQVCKKLRDIKRPGVSDTYTLEQHIDIHNSLINLHRNNDIILRFRDIFDKEYLRRMLALNIDNWKETYFDIIYDNYMSLQNKGIINESNSI